MDYARLETATLADVDQSFYYAASCRGCSHTARLNLLKLRDHLGGAFPLVKVRQRLKCERCGGRQIIVTFLAPDQRTGNLSHLFDQHQPP
jgi:predicted nucleic-acid-binding Zn-ribbon protein